MRDVTEIKKVYSFKDIQKNEDLRKKVINLHYNINVDFEWWEYIYEDETTRLQKLGYNGPDIKFSGFDSQGDGANFISNDIDIKKILDRMDLEIRLGLEQYVIDWFKVWIDRISHHYYHYNTVDVKSDFEYSGYSNIDLYLEDIVEEIHNFIAWEVKEESKKIYKKLRDDYYYYISDKGIMETLKVNEYEFLKDGRIYSK